MGSIYRQQKKHYAQYEKSILTIRVYDSRSVERLFYNIERTMNKHIMLRLTIGEDSNARSPLTSLVLLCSHLAFTHGQLLVPIMSALGTRSLCTISICIDCRVVMSAWNEESVAISICRQLYVCAAKRKTSQKLKGGHSQ